MIRSGRDLRHVDDGLDALLFRRVGEDARCLEQSFSDGIHEVRARGAAHGATHVLDVAQVADDDLRAERRELLGALIGREHKRAHG
jgi:hypothetical protein